MDSKNKIELFYSLIRSVQYCNLCDQCTYNKVLSNKNGNINSKVMFIAEAPGRLGADKYGIPLYGDKTGDTFEKLLSNIGWDRDSIFITNAILCNLRDKNGNNRTPTEKEIKNCSLYLEMTINLISPDVIVTLGQKALSALNYIYPHRIVMKDQVGKAIKWRNNILIVPLYHPGPRALIHRSLSKQRGDYISLSSYVHPTKGIKEYNGGIKRINKIHDRNTLLSACIYSILQIQNYCSYFKLMKLLYLIDHISIERYGYSQTKSIFLRRQDGPWCPYVYNILSDGIETGEIKKFRIDNNTFYQLRSNHLELYKPEVDYELIKEVCEKYGELDNQRIKIVVYSTKPMKYIIRQENQGVNMTNRPIIYLNNTILDEIKQ